MPTDEVRLKFTADLGDLTAELSKNKNLTAEQVKALVKSLAQANAAAEKAAKKAAKESADAMKKAAKAAEDAAKKSESAWAAAGKDIAGSIGIAGAAALGLGAATVKAGMEAVQALDELIQFASDTITKLEELGAVTILSERQIDSVKDLSAQMELVKLTSGAAAAALLSALSPALTRVLELTLGLTLALIKLTGQFDSGAISVRSWGAVLGAVATRQILPALEAIRSVYEAFDQQSNSLDVAIVGLRTLQTRYDAAAFAVSDATEEQKFWNDYTLDAGALVDETIPKIRALAEAKDEDAAATKESTDALKTQSIAIKMLGALSREAGETVSAAARKAADSVGASSGIMAGTFVKAVEVIDQKLEESREKQAAALAAATDAVNSMVSNVQSIFADISGLIMAAHERSLESIDEQIEAERKYFKTATGADKEASKKRLENLKRQREAQKESMMDVWKAQQAAAITMAVINGILAGVTTLAQLGATPWGIAAAALAVAAGTTAAVAIAAEPPPKFHTGLTPGLSPVETPATLDRGEAVLNRRAVADLGTEVIGRANRGTLRQQGGGSAMTAIFLNDRVVDHITANGILRGGQTRLALATVPNYKGGYK